MSDGVSKLVTGPASEPVTLTEAKAQCRVDISDDDTYIGTLITVAREYCELHDWRVYLPQTWELWLEAWPTGDEIVLPKAPLASITKIEYYDTADVKSTLSTSVYTADTISEPGQARLKYNQSWPSGTLRDYNAICVTYVAGYASAAAVPQRIKQAILLLVGHWYETRENILVGTISKPIDFGLQSLLGVNRGFRF